MIIDCISDLHGYEPKLLGGDLLIIAGDMTAMDTRHQNQKFLIWLTNQSYRYKILIGGNHDNIMQEWLPHKLCDNIEYLCDNGCEFEGMKIWGSPWTLQFANQNPDAMAFTVKSEFQLMDKFDLIPMDTNILITHSPPYDKGDTCSKGRVGSIALSTKCLLLSNLKLHVFGHIHEGYGIYHRAYSHDGPIVDLKTDKVTPIGYPSVNASFVDGRYRPANKPIRIIL